jgi:hypothetical protein
MRKIHVDRAWIAAIRTRGVRIDKHTTPDCVEVCRRLATEKTAKDGHFGRLGQE